MCDSMLALKKSHFQGPESLREHPESLTFDNESQCSQHILSYEWNISLTRSNFMPYVWYKGPYGITISAREEWPDFLRGFLHIALSTLAGIHIKCMWWPVNEFKPHKNCAQWRGLLQTRLLYPDMAVLQMATLNSSNVLKLKNTYVSSYKIQHSIHFIGEMSPKNEHKCLHNVQTNT